MRFAPFSLMFTCWCCISACPPPTVLLLTNMSLSLAWNMTWLKLHALPRRTARQNRLVRQGTTTAQQKGYPSFLGIESCLKIVLREKRGKLQTNGSPLFMNWHLKPGINVYSIRDLMTLRGKVFYKTLLLSEFSPCRSRQQLGLKVPFHCPEVNNVTQWFLITYRTVKLRWLPGSCKRMMWLRVTLQPASLPDVSPAVAVGALPGETGMTVVPHAVCEVANNSDSSVHTAQLPSPPDHLWIMWCPWMHLPSPQWKLSHMTTSLKMKMTQLGALTQDHIVFRHT